MADLIYSDWLVGLLYHLGRSAPADGYRTKQSINGFFDIPRSDVDSVMKRAGGGKDDCPGWPKERWFVDGKPDEDFAERIHKAFDAIGECYSGPLLVAVKARYYLFEHGIVIDELEAAAGISDSGRKRRVRPCLPERWEDCTSDRTEWKAFCNIFITRCVRERSDFVKGSGLLTLSLAVLTDTAIRAEKSDGTTIDYRPDSSGPVAHNLPKTDVDLLYALLPRQALTYLEDETELPEQLGEGLINQLLHGGNIDWLCGILSKYFVSDGGSRYSLMVANARGILPLGHDYELFKSRLSRLYRVLREQSRKPERVACSWSEMLEHSRGDGARLLSSFVLSVIVGPESSEILRVILRGRWG